MPSSNHIDRYGDHYPSSSMAIVSDFESKGLLVVPY